MPFKFEKIYSQLTAFTVAFIKQYCQPTATSASEPPSSCFYAVTSQRGGRIQPGDACVFSPERAKAAVFMFLRRDKPAGRQNTTRGRVHFQP